MLTSKLLDFIISEILVAGRSAYYLVLVGKPRNLCPALHDIGADGSTIKKYPKQMIKLLFIVGNNCREVETLNRKSVIKLRGI